MIMIVAIGQKQPAWINEAFADYTSRLPSEFPLELRELKIEPRNTGRKTAEIRRIESEKLKSAIPDGILKVLLDEQGKEVGTAEFQRFLFDKIETHRKVAFLIGGPDGFDKNLKDECKDQIKLSSLTLPHGLVRIIFVEQIYRAWTIHKNHPYHRA